MENNKSKNWKLIGAYNSWNIKLLNRKIEMENEVTENEIRNEIKVQTKYWYECWYCSREHSKKNEKNIIIE